MLHEMTKALAVGSPGLSSCAAEGIRTPNLLIRSQMLYPLSYSRMVIQLCTGFPGCGGGERI